MAMCPRRALLLLLLVRDCYPSLEEVSCAVGDSTCAAEKSDAKTDGLLQRSNQKAQIVDDLEDGVEAELNTTTATTPTPDDNNEDLTAAAQDDDDGTDWDIEDQGTIEHLESDVDNKDASSIEDGQATLDTTTATTPMLDVDEKDASLIAAGQRDVLCGGHRAPTCAECPQGNGRGWCNGVCFWKDNACHGLPDLTPSNPFGCQPNGLCRARTASIHFNYKRPDGARTPSWYYNQLTPKETSDATFFAMSTTGYGYAGIQTVWKDQSRNKDRMVICSIWDQNTGNAKMETCGEGVVCKGFGGEGTGAKAMWYFDWQLGNHYAFMLHRQFASDGSGRVEHSCWFYAQELESAHLGGWKHIATATSGANHYGTTFADSGSFLEQWTHMNSNENRMGEYGPAYYKNENGEWKQSKLTRFSVYYLQERLRNKEVRADRISANQALGTRRLYMQTGGNAQEPKEQLREPRQLQFPQSPCGLPASLYSFEASKDGLLGRGNVATSSSKSCGGHRASTCAGCPFDERTNKSHGMSWCNGDCAWKHQQCMLPNSSPCPPNGVSCGGHRSASCSECPFSTNGHNHGRWWCNGECAWILGTCRDK